MSITLSRNEIKAEWENTVSGRSISAAYSTVAAIRKKHKTGKISY